MKLNTTNIANLLIAATVLTALVLTHNPVVILALLIMRDFDVNEAAIESGMSNIQAIGEEGAPGEESEYSGQGKIGFMN